MTTDFACVVNKVLSVVGSKDWTSEKLRAPALVVSLRPEHSPLTDAASSCTSWFQ